jgi:hypothetical protein
MVSSKIDVHQSSKYYQRYKWYGWDLIEWWNDAATFQGSLAPPSMPLAAGL